MSAASNILLRGDLHIKFKSNGSIASSSDSPVFTLYDLENRAINSLNEFNQNYATYLRCTDDLNMYDQDQPNYNIVYPNKNGCPSGLSSKQINIDNLTISQNKLIQHIDALNNALTLIKNLDNGVTQQQYDAKYASIIAKYKEIVDMDKEIKQKLKDIDAVNYPRRKKDSPYIEDIYEKYNASMYSTLMLTVLATSLIYYAFVKI
jgi:hypothetical protein